MAGGFTSVNGQILDPSGNVYANSRIFASFIGQSTTPGAGPYLLGGLPSGQFETIVVEQADSFGNFNMLLADNNVVLPSPSQWSFTVVAQDGKTAFGVLITVTGATQTITAALQAAAAPLNPTSAFNALTVGKLDNFRYVDGVKFPTIQSAINDLGSPAFGTVYIPPGVYTQNVALTIPAGSSIQVIGAGRGATVINSSLTSGNLFPFTNMSEFRVSDVTIVNTGAGGGNAFILNYAQRCMIERFTIQGPWANGIVVNGREGAGSAIFISIRDGLITGPTVSCITYDSTGETNQTINSNQIFNCTCTCGGNSGIALKFAGPNFICNENGIYHSQFTAPGGTGVSLANTSVRDLVMIGCTLEGSANGFVNGTGNKVILIGCEISANTNANFTDGSSGLTIVIGGNIGGQTQTFFLDSLGNMKVLSIAFGGANPAANNINCGAGNGLQTGGSQLLLFNANSLEVVKALQLDAAAAVVGAGQVSIGSTTAATATAGAQALPAQPAGFLIVNIGGTTQKIPYYNS